METETTMFKNKYVNVRQNEKEKKMILKLRFWRKGKITVLLVMGVRRVNHEALSWTCFWTCLPREQSVTFYHC